MADTIGADTGFTLGGVAYPVVQVEMEYTPAKLTVMRSGFLRNFGSTPKRIWHLQLGFLTTAQMATLRGLLNAGKVAVAGGPLVVPVGTVTVTVFMTPGPYVWRNGEMQQAPTLLMRETA